MSRAEARRAPGPQPRVFTGPRPAGLQVAKAAPVLTCMQLLEGADQGMANRGTTRGPETLLSVYNWAYMEKRNREETAAALR